MPVLNPNDPNVVMLELVARRLGTALCEQFAFVGGAAAGLLITDPAQPAIRPTEDVDLVVEVLSLSAYHRTEAALQPSVCGCLAGAFAHRRHQPKPLA